MRMLGQLSFFKCILEKQKAKKCRKQKARQKAKSAESQRHPKASNEHLKMSLKMSKSI